MAKAGAPVGLVEKGRVPKSLATLLNMGRRADGIAAAEKAVEAGKAEKADTSGLEKRIAELKAAKT